MNGRLELLWTDKSARLASCVGLTLFVGGCLAGPTSRANIDPGSPIAADARKLEAAQRSYPSFAKIPPAPKDVRPLTAFAESVADARAAAARLEAETGPETWSLTGTERFAATAERQIGPDPGPASPEDTEAFARSLRERATPPPPPR